MSDSSTENRDADAGDPVTQKDTKQVPVEAVAKERAEKRAAREEVARLKQDVEKQGLIDDALIEQLAAEAKAIVDRELAPEREARSKAERENSLLRLRLDHGLTDEQATMALDFKAKNPNLSLEQSLLLVRAENPEAFASAPSGPVTPSGIPVGGASRMRQASGQDDFIKKMQEARSSGDWKGAREFAALELQRRVQAMTGKARTD